MKGISVVETRKAIGLILCHDITEIVPKGADCGEGHSGQCCGGHKGPAFRRGHVVREEDVEHLLRLGKEHLYVWNGQSEGWVHEDDAALRIAKAAAGPGVAFGTPKEGRINFTAAHQGLLRIDCDLLERVNSIQNVTLATTHTMQEVAEGRMLAGTRVIPLAVPEGTVQAVEACCAAQPPLLQVLPFKPHKVALVITGSEVYHGRVQDGFGPVLEKKFTAWGSRIVSKVIMPDEAEQTAEAIRAAIDGGAELVAVSGGMSVDPDDKTPLAIRSVGCEIVTYGVPVFPGAMFMLGYKGNVPVVGLPGCVMYHRASIFDILMPRILAGIRLTPRDISSLAHGGLCESCPECRYPACGFGKG